MKEKAYVLNPHDDNGIISRSIEDVTEIFHGRKSEKIKA